MAEFEDVVARGQFFVSKFESGKIETGKPDQFRGQKQLRVKNNSGNESGLRFGTYDFALKPPITSFPDTFQTGRIRMPHWWEM